MLYPFLFQPILKSVIWGGDQICTFKGMESQQQNIGESWEISAVKNNVSIVANGDLQGQSLDDLIRTFGSRLLGAQVSERFGTTFPLLIKFIDARDALSIQVHPNDQLAKERHNSFGKTEMWYLIRCTPSAYLYSGFSKQLSPEGYLQSLEDDTFINYLDKHEVQAGDVFYLPAGRVHAIGAGCLIAEIQQTSDITYRIYDYNRRDSAGNPRELHTELAKDAIDYTIHSDHKLAYQPQHNSIQNLVACPYFTTNLIETDRKETIDLASRDSFSVYICMEGQLELTDDKGCCVQIKQGQTVLIPAECKGITLNPAVNCKLLETFIGR
ncbi:MAG: class I mannose-6-phosphate isomerase [Dysgonamonadaceae bacterium]|jgi:mannose-6-phosphate isomerase|nr:class I mannose-6-phosphate isomerase [Dysgonamonadaceae bacterium]